jgi:hypothetical protein
MFPTPITPLSPILTWLSVSLYRHRLTIFFWFHPPLFRYRPYWSLVCAGWWSVIDSRGWTFCALFFFFLCPPILASLCNQNLKTMLFLTCRYGKPTCLESVTKKVSNKWCLTCRKLLLPFSSAQWEFSWLTRFSPRRGKTSLDGQMSSGKAALWMTSTGQPKRKKPPCRKALWMPDASHPEWKTPN